MQGKLDINLVSKHKSACNCFCSFSKPRPKFFSLNPNFLAVITQELEYQYATRCQEIDAIRYREEFEEESWRGDSANDGIDCDLLDDDSDDDLTEA